MPSKTWPIVKSYLRTNDQRIRPADVCRRFAAKAYELRVRLLDETRRRPCGEKFDRCRPTGQTARVSKRTTINARQDGRAGRFNNPEVNSMDEQT